MINVYSYIETSHSKLHEFVMAFFDRIEYEKGDFTEDFYVTEFWDNVVSHHPEILNSRFKFIHETIKDWTQTDKSKLIKGIRESNEIEKICAGRLKPLKDINIPETIRLTVKELFRSLYETVLRKAEHHGPHYGFLKDHYLAFQKHKNNKYDYCPACGIWPMKAAEEGRDQYDHYLPKENYPFSSVNFRNLVPICGQCNTVEVKSNKDILSFTGVAFYPFNETHKCIDIDVKITKNDPDEMANIEWAISYSNPDGKKKEIEAWQSIYKIVDRHKNHVKGHIDKWYGKYNEWITDKDTISQIPNDADRVASYLRFVKKGKLLQYQVLNELVKIDTRARAESKAYSRY